MGTVHGRPEQVTSLPKAQPVEVGVALAEAAAVLRRSGSESARLDAELLLAHVLGVHRTAVLAHPGSTLGPGVAEAFAVAVGRRASGEPVAYIRGVKEFYGLSFAVDRRVLIPRSETELLVDLALERIAGAVIAARRREAMPPARVWDVGTGSGAVAVALAVSLRRRRQTAEVRVLATDVSPDALAVARENAARYGVADTIELRLADLRDIRGGLDAREEGAMDLIVANLPYVPSLEVSMLPVAARFEPRAALDGGRDGLDLVRRVLALLPGTLVRGGVALVEIGSTQEEAARAAAAAALPGWPATVHADLAGRPRVLEVRHPRGVVKATVR